jgi:hypothetical protein
VILDVENASIRVQNCFEAKVFGKSLEFLRPNESLSIAKYIKVVGYGCIYQSVAEVPHTDITLSIVCARSPVKLRRELLGGERYRVAENHRGIYEIAGELFPVQIINSARLPREDNIWLNSLGKNLSVEELERISELKGKMGKKISMEAYYYTLLHANQSLIREAMRMTKATLMRDFVETGLAAEFIAIGEKKGKREGKREGVSSTIFIINGLKNQIPPEQLAAEAELSLDEVEMIKAAL